MQAGRYQHTETFQRTVSHYRQALSDLASRLYNELYLDADFPALMALYLGARWMEMPLEQQRQTYMQSQFRVVLPEMPDSHQEDLWTLFEREAISWEEFVAHTRRSTGFAADHAREALRYTPEHFLETQVSTRAVPAAGADKPQQDKQKAAEQEPQREEVRRTKKPRRLREDTAADGEQDGAEVTA